MEERVLTILSGILGAEEGELDADLDLFEAGLLDSFAIVQLFVELEDAFGAVLDPAALTREEIATPALIAQQVYRALQES